VSAPAKIQVDWEAHLEALPVPTWIIHTRAGPDAAHENSECGPFFVNGACREALGLTPELVKGREWTRYLHPEDRHGTLVAWTDFLEGKSARFHRIVRWIRPDTKETVSLAVRAQKLLCGDIQGWLRSAAAEQALSRLEELTHGRR
jgi:PAS domain-containing protein